MDCLICFENRSDNFFCTLQCSHELCFFCLQKWIETQAEKQSKREQGDDLTGNFTEEGFAEGFTEGFTESFTEGFTCPYCRQDIVYYFNKFTRQFVSIKDEVFFIYQKYKRPSQKRDCGIFLLFFLNFIAPLALARLLFFSLPLIFQCGFIISMSLMLISSCILSII
jgi:hypothetical protein